MNKIELLAPAGNLEILKAAVDAGADAVYCGTGAFNARINAGNLSMEDLAEGCLYAHLRSSKVYLTLNTIVNSYELSEALDTAQEAYEAGIDGIIIQDLGLAREISIKYPDIPLHASTQMNVFGCDDFETLRDLGFKRVVLPRELSVDEISKRTRIAGSYNMTTEVFAHGAVCICYSGLCLFSAMNKSGTRSGNRGLCAQPCREAYKLINDGLELKSGHLLSPKDRDVIDYIDSLVKGGVASLKIEGRMRDKNYVTSAVWAYRRIIDAYYDGYLDEELIESVKNDLLVNFNRGGSYTSQYLSGNKPDNLLSGDYPGKFGLKLGRIITTDSKKGTITFSWNRELPLPAKGDYLSVRKDNEELNSFPLGKIHESDDRLVVKGLHPDMIVKLSRGNDIYLMGHETKIAKDDLKKTHINLSVSIEKDIISINALVIDGINNGIYADFDLDLPMEFEGTPLSEERIISQLGKTGDTPYIVDQVYFVTDEPVKCSVSLINELRRGVLNNLSDEIEEAFRRNIMSEYVLPDLPQISDVPGTDSIMHIYPTIRLNPMIIQPGADIYCFSIYDMAIKPIRERACKVIKEEDAKLAIMLPDMYHDRLNKIITNVFDNLKEILGDSFSYVLDGNLLSDGKLYKEYNLKHMLSSGANLYNEKTLKLASEKADAGFVSLELSPSETVDMLRNSSLSRDFTLILQNLGPVNWMQTDFCPVGNNHKHCDKCSRVATFDLRQREEGEKELKVIPRNMDCSSTIMGPAKNLYSDEEIEELNSIGFNTISVFTCI